MHDAEPAPPSRRRRRRLLVIALVVVVGALLLMVWGTRPKQVAGLVTDGLGDALGLEIRARGISEYTWRGQPSLTLRDVEARVPGAATPMLRADRMHVRLPWSTVRSRGRELTLTRVEADAPEIDLAAFQEWWASRPPGEERPLRITEGVHVERGRLRGEGWRIDDFALGVERVVPERPMPVETSGRYVAETMAARFDLDLALSRPALPAELRANGRVQLEASDWRMPATLVLSGPLSTDARGLHVRPLRFGAGASYVAGGARVPFRLGLYGPLSIVDGVVALEPATVALRPQSDDGSPVPSLDARGALAFGERLVLRLDGALAGWPAAWPALPAPIGQSDAPLPFALRYQGATDLTATTALRVTRKDAAFEGRFRLPAVLDWIDAGANGSPLPPLEGTLRADTLEIAGATLEGVRIEMRDEAAAP